MTTVRVVDTKALDIAAEGLAVEMTKLIKHLNDGRKQGWFTFNRHVPSSAQITESFLISEQVQECLDEYRYHSLVASKAFLRRDGEIIHPKDRRVLLRFVKGTDHMSRLKRWIITRLIDE